MFGDGSDDPAAESTCEALLARALEIAPGDAEALQALEGGPVKAGPADLESAAGCGDGDAENGILGVHARRRRRRAKGERASAKGRGGGEDGGRGQGRHETLLITLAQ